MDFYSLLGVPSTAAPESIKSAFRKQALKHHPDVASESTGHLSFILLKNAFDILSHPEKRQDYDEYLQNSRLFRETLRSGASADSGKTRLADGRSGREEILNHFNYILWEIEDLLFEDGRTRRRTPGAATERLLELLRDIDRLILEPAGQKDYFFESRRMSAMPEARSGFSGPEHHAPFVNVNDYFYNIRTRANDLFRGARLLDFSTLSEVNGKSLSENILAVYNRVIEETSRIRK